MNRKFYSTLAATAVVAGLAYCIFGLVYMSEAEQIASLQSQNIALTWGQAFILSSIKDWWAVPLSIVTGFYVALKYFS